MRNIRLTIAYDGSAYAGWQRQKSVETVQGVLEGAISVMTGTFSTLNGAGRTDAGVHALAMTANFNTEATIPCPGFFKGLNSILPNDVRILAVEDVDMTFHSRYSAKGKSYIYHFVNSPVLLPTERLYNAHLNYQPIHLPDMKSCLDLLVGEHDFSSFETAGSRDLDKKEGIGAIRTIYQAMLTEISHEHFIIEIKGNGFLRHMVRNIVGTLFEVGKGKISIDRFKNILYEKSRSAAGPTAPPEGLFLRKVYYQT